MKRREAIVGIALLAAMSLPIEQSSKFELIVNVGAAKAKVWRSRNRRFSGPIT